MKELMGRTTVNYDNERIVKKKKKVLL